MKAPFAFALLTAAAFAGCTGKGEVEYSGDVHVASADLVTIEPGLQVIADADQPLFYVDGSYYLLRDGVWLRSNSYRGGFARIDHVPHRLRDLDRPQAYVHYRTRTDRGFAERQLVPEEQPQPIPPQQPPQATPMPDQRPLPKSAQRNPSPGPQPIPQDTDQPQPD